ncbi:acyl-CoA thioesterase [Leptospira idonii]|uniref:Thioesterase n=1 Tax=Leptospira idonii TaxID=1193500 RepID=A0A4R9LZA3_9LEPT|nr:thioesterase family protein [Leptospira idonii]TGN19690.1 thioesterase [Leptospira idonii]
MARIKLTLPDVWHYSTSLSVRISDINFAGHLAHDSILSLIHEARAQFFNHMEFGELDVEGKGIVVADVVITYANEAFFRDSLQIQIAASEFTKKGCDFYYRLSNEKTGKEIARAKTGIVFFDYTERKPCEIPQSFLKHFT